jgi:hypothetical protein
LHRLHLRHRSKVSNLAAFVKEQEVAWLQVKMHQAVLSLQAVEGVGSVTQEIQSIGAAPQKWLAVSQLLEMGVQRCLGQLGYDNQRPSIHDFHVVQRQYVSVTGFLDAIDPS